MSDLLGEILRITVEIKKAGYSYDFSEQTLAAKQDYDEEVAGREVVPILPYKTAWQRTKFLREQIHF